MHCVSAKFTGYRCSLASVLVCFTKCNLLGVMDVLLFYWIWRLCFVSVMSKLTQMCTRLAKSLQKYTVGYKLKRWQTFSSSSSCGRPRTDWTHDLLPDSHACTGMCTHMHADMRTHTHTNTHTHCMWFQCLTGCHLALLSPVIVAWNLLECIVYECAHIYSTTSLLLSLIHISEPTRPN